MFLVSWSNLKTKKTQNTVIAVILLLSALLLTTAAVVLTNTDGYFDDVHLSANGSHTLLQFENGLHDPEDVHAWWSEQEGVETTSLFRYVNLSQFIHEGREVANITLYMTNAGENPLASPVDRLIFADREHASPFPEPGTIWIPTSLAYSQSIRIGDILGFKRAGETFSYRVSGIVVDLPFSQPFTVTARIWMNESDYARLTAAGDAQEKALMGIRFADPAKEQAHWGRFAEQFGTPFLETITDYTGLTSFYFLVGTVLGRLMIFMSLIMLAIALYTVSYTISDTILSGYRTIGIYQSLGMTGSRIARTYMLQYGLLALIAAIPGASAGYYGAEAILSMTMAYLRIGNEPLVAGFLPYAAGAVLFVVALTVAFAWLFASRARKIDPVQAIRYGTAEQRQPRAGSLGRTALRLPVELIIGLRRMRGNKGSALMAVLVSALTTAVLATGVLIYTSVKNLRPPEWGYDNADISIEVMNGAQADPDEIERALREHPSVDHVGRLGSVYAVPAEVPEGVVLSGIHVSFMNGDLDRIGYATIEGRHPATGTEIALGARAAELLGKRIGDQVELYIQGRKAGYTVTGIYQAITNMSLTARLTADGIARLSLAEEPAAPLFFVRLKEGADPEAFIAEMRVRFGDEIFAASQETLIREVFGQAGAILIWPLLAMGLFILGIAYGIAYSVNRIHVKRDSRMLGIYRSLGMTAGRLRLAILSGTTLQTIAGVLLGLIIGTVFMPNLLDAMLKNYGIVEFPAVWNAGLLAAAVAAGCAAMLFGSWLASAAVSAQPLRSLAEET
jgi:putative ABC transport system permease protein